MNEFAIPVDPAGSGRLSSPFTTTHYYTPFPFCLMSEPADWGGIVYPATTWGTSTEQAERAGLFQTLAAFTASRDIPAVIGEFTVTTGSGAYVRESASRIRWMRAVSETAMSHGMVPVLWDTGEDVRRSDGSLSSDLGAVMTELGFQALAPRRFPVECGVSRTAERRSRASLRLRWSRKFAECLPHARNRPPRQACARRRRR